MPSNSMQNNRRAPGVVFAEIPEGFIVATGPDKKEYLVPEFLLPYLELEFAARKQQIDLDVASAQGGPLQAQRGPYEIIAEGHILFPPDPPLSEMELMNAHAKIIALQHKLGISYKDASHRLYIAHVERLKVSDAAYKAIKSIDDELDNILKSLNGHI